jgi:hypothetical protein
MSLNEHKFEVLPKSAAGRAALCMSVPGTKQRWRAGRACPLCPGISDVNLFRYFQGVIDLDAEISDRAFDFGVTEQ